jgi:ComF family protein
MPTGPTCPHCAQPVTQLGPCANCENELPVFSRTVAALEYRYPADILVRDLKYRSQIQLAPLLASLLCPKILGHGADRIAFVPQSRERQRSRGYNQAEEIARQLSHQSGIPLLQPALKRILETSHQAGLDAKARRANLNQAFLCAGGAQNLKIAVVDDVMTTGATQNALAHVLKQAGAREVFAWVVARTPPHDFAPMR